MIPGPPELLPGRPEAIVDLQTDEGAALVGARWRSKISTARRTFLADTELEVQRHIVIDEYADTHHAHAGIAG